MGELNLNIRGNFSRAKRQFRRRKVDFREVLNVRLNFRELPHAHSVAEVQSVLDSQGTEAANVQST